MKPFSIVCRSCAARLKVTKASAIGQKLSCPKCGIMIDVVAPDGWVVPQQQASSTSHSSVADAMPGDFEDIDDILFNSDTPPNKPTQDKPVANKAPVPSQASPSPRPASNRNPRGKSSKLKPRIPHPDVKSNRGRQPAASHSTDRKSQNGRQQVAASNPDMAETMPAGMAEGLASISPRVGTRNSPRPSQRRTQPADVTPVLPNDQWTSDQTRQKRKLLFVFAALLSSILVIGILITAVVLNSGNAPQLAEVENIEPGEEVVQQNREDDLMGQNPDRPLPPEKEEAIDVFNNNPPPIEPDEELPKNEPQPPAGEEPDKDIKIATQLEPETDDDEVMPKPQPDQQDPEMQEPEEPGLSPFAEIENNPNLDIDIEPNRSPENTAPGDSGTVSEKMGDLANLLRRSGTDLFEIKDLTAAIRDQGPIGMPKYVVERPDSARPDLNKLDSVLGGIKLEKSPLIKSLRVFESITGVPIFLDAYTIAHFDLKPNPIIETLIAGKTVRESVKEILSPHGMELIPDDETIVVGIPFDPANFNSSYDLTGVRGIADPDTAKRITVMIKTLIQPKIWTDPENTATITIAAQFLEANCNKYAHKQIEDLVLKLKACSKLIENPDDQESLNQVQTKWRSIQPKLEWNPNQTHGIQKDIGSFFNELEQTTGVGVVIDWPSVLKEGWNPLTKIPGNLIEPTTGDVIREICHAMELSAIVADESTVVLTTTEHSYEMLDLEVFPIREITNTGFTSTNLLELIDNSIGRQLMLRIYEPQCECIVVVGSQSVQRQVQALMDKLSRN